MYMKHFLRIRTLLLRVLFCAGDVKIWLEPGMLFSDLSHILTDMLVLFSKQT